MTELELREWMSRRVARLRGGVPASIDVNAPFDALGLSSLAGVELAGELGELLHVDVPPTLVYDHPSIALLAAYLAHAGRGPSPGHAAAPGPAGHEPIAVVGVACRFPGAADPVALWRLLREGRDAVTEVPASRWDAAALYDPDASAPGKSVTRWGGFLDDIEGFDPHAFGISPGEAERIDPQQRILLELAHEALDDAGEDAARLAGTPTGVFVGISVNEYAERLGRSLDALTGHSATGNVLAVAANRISYTLDLAGPSLALDTACSSSLAAVHLACRSLRAGECTMALAGGVNVMLSPAHSVAFSKAGVLARDGRCKPFDARADGYVRGEGGGVVVLKPLARALRSGDRVLAVLLGSAMGHNGRTNGLVAPRQEGQEAVLRAACRDAGVLPSRVQYVEAHGTGTLLGDAIEAAALGAVMAPGRDGPPCGLGSIKSNIGHLEAAAGIAGLIKVVLALRHGELPPTLHVREPNPTIPFARLALEVVRERRPWDPSRPRIAGVSSFGFGGANVHVVVGEGSVEASSRVSAPPADATRACLLPLSSHDPAGLVALARAWQGRLRSPPAGEVPLESLCATAARRTHRARRLALVLRSREQGAAALAAFVRGVPDIDVLLGTATSAGLTFVFSGQGSQGPAMGLGLMRQEPVFARAMAECEVALAPYVGPGLLQRLHKVGAQEDAAGIERVQPLLFAIQVALARLWIAFGLQPDAIVGHSMGEVAAAHIAGALSLEDAAHVICTRSRLLGRLRGRGALAVVGLAASEALAQARELGLDLHVAAENSPVSTVLGGPPDGIARLAARLGGAGVPCHVVAVDVPAHGPETAPLAQELRVELAGIVPRASAVPFVSSVAGAVVDGAELDAGYWARNLTEPVRFATALEVLAGRGCSTFLEISPHPVLQAAITQSALHAERPVQALASLRRDVDDRTALLRAAGALYAAGRPLAWPRLQHEELRAQDLPLPPWRRTRCWIEDVGPPAPPSSDGATRGLVGRPVPLADVGGHRVWELTLGDPRPPWLADHRVLGETIVPAAAFVDAALAAAGQLGLGGTHDVRDLVLHAPLAVPAGTDVRVQLTVRSPDASGPGACAGPHALSVHARSCRSEAEEFVLHASASLFPRAAQAEPADGGLAAALQRCTSPLEPAGLYAGLAERGLEHGLALRRVRRVMRGADEALGWIDADAASCGHEPGRVDPALLDAALHVLGALAAGSAAAYVPRSVRRVALLAPLRGTIVAHAVARGDPRDGTSADVTLFAEDGTRLALLEGLRFARLEARSEPAGLWRYALAWEPALRDVPQPFGHTAPSEEGDVLILDQADEVADVLARRLAERGIAAVRAPTPASDRSGEAAGRLEALGRRALRDVVLFAPASPTGARGGPRSLAHGREACARTLSLVQALVRDPGAHARPRLWLVTRGAQAARGGAPASPAAALLWGLGRSLRLEIPELRTMLVDLDLAAAPASSAEALDGLLATSVGEQDLALRGAQHLTPRLIPYRGSGGPARLSLRADATYLVTGGLGGLGLQVARRLVERGARHVALLSRDVRPARAPEALAALRALGAQVRLLPVDVSHPVELASALTGLRAQAPPLRGVIHAAGVLANGSLLDLTQERLHEVTRSKLEGGWALHEATLGDPLEHFVLFSSAVSVLGSPGQAAYAAGNAALDALAAHRRSLGRPAVSIGWGPWAEVGMVAGGVSLGAAVRRGDEGVKSIPPQQGLAALEEALGGRAAHLLVLPFDLTSLLELHPAAAALPLFAGLRTAASPSSRLYARPELAQPYVEPRNDVERRIAELWRRTLRIERVGIHDSFFELGGDSVLAAQVVTAVHRTFGVSLDLRQAFRSFTVAATAQAVEQGLLARVEALDEDEARRLLEEGA